MCIFDNPFYLKSLNISFKIYIIIFKIYIIINYFQKKFNNKFHYFYHDIDDRNNELNYAI